MHRETSEIKFKLQDHESGGRLFYLSAASVLRLRIDHIWILDASISIHDNGNEYELMVGMEWRIEGERSGELIGSIITCLMAGAR